jgi:hypothetical protein
MILAPGETCVHVINGPKGVLDFSKLKYADSSQAMGCLRGWSVSSLIGVRGDFVNPDPATAYTYYGGRYAYRDGTKNKISAPISIEVTEVFKLRCPEVIGFTSTGGGGGTEQQLDLRKDRFIFVNFEPINSTVYKVNNEENPLLDQAASSMN